MRVIFIIHYINYSTSSLCLGIVATVKSNIIESDKYLMKAYRTVFFFVFGFADFCTIIEFFYFYVKVYFNPCERLEMNREQPSSDVFRSINHFRVLFKKENFKVRRNILHIKNLKL